MLDILILGGYGGSSTLESFLGYIFAGKLRLLLIILDSLDNHSFFPGPLW
jgi:hypothetical protein